MITVQGKGVSAGVGIGPLYFYRRATTEIKRYTVEDTDAEWHRFKGAQTGAIEQLGQLAEQARAEAGDEAAMLFETHQMMAEDLDYEEAIENLITNEKLNAEAAVSDVAEQFAEMFAAMDDTYMQARAADVKDVSQRILSILCGVVQGGIASEVPVLLAADDLAPSETIQLDKSKILGFVTAGGSGSSHTAILARTMGIPAIVGLGDALKPEYEGRQAIADGSTGALVVDPDDDTRDRLVKKREEQLRLQRLLETLKGQANVTKDGKTIRIYCNIGSPEDVHAVQVNDGGGIGLFRSEFLYMQRQDGFPDEQVQTAAYARAAELCGGRPLVIRTLDIGGDKSLPYYRFPEEENPFLGWRAIRVSLELRDMFRTQFAGDPACQCPGRRAGDVSDDRLARGVARRAGAFGGVQGGAAPAGGAVRRPDSGRGDDRDAGGGVHGRRTGRRGRFFQHRHQRPHAVRAGRRSGQPADRCDVRYAASGRGARDAADGRCGS